MCSWNSSTMFPSIFMSFLPFLLHFLHTASCTKIINPSLYKYDTEVIKNRQTDFQVLPAILSRRSMKNMDGRPIKHDDLMALFEAARWAPSTYNLQVWRFVYAERNSPYWDKYFDLLTQRNQKWAKDGAVLVVVLSNKFESYKEHKLPVKTHSFDAGGAAMALSLEGTARGLVVHTTSGFDPEKVAYAIGLDPEIRDEYTIEAILVIGNRAFKGRPERTTQRNEINQFVSEGVFVEKLGSDR